jgi:hypothetical protein
MTVDEKVWELAQLLHSKTTAGEIKWEHTAEKNTFLTAFPRHSIRIGHDAGSDSYTISIFNEYGALVEQADDRSIMRLTGTRRPNTLMSELFTTARRSALGADSALDELIAELSGPPQPRLTSPETLR